MKLFPPTTLAIALLSVNAMAAEDNAFQHEATVGYLTNSDEISDGILGVSYRYYASPVEQNSSPYALNGFLSQESNIGAIYSDFDVFDINTVGVDGTYVFDSNWFVGLNYQRTGIGNVDFNTYGIELGYYVNENTSLSAFFDDGTADNAEERYGLAIRRYLALDSTPGIDLSANWLHADSENYYILGADWYVSNSWSVGSGYTRDADNGDFDLRTAYWWRISDDFSANVSVSKIINEDIDGVDLGITLTGRF